MASMQWARLNEDVFCGLRRGAWYRVLFAGNDFVAVDVERERLLIPHDILADYVSSGSNSFVDNPDDTATDEATDLTKGKVARWARVVMYRSFTLHRPTNFIPSIKEIAVTQFSRHHMR